MHKLLTLKISGFICAFDPAAPGSSPKHTFYAFIIYSQICAIFVMWKEQNKQKEAGFGPFFKKKNLLVVLSIHMQYTLITYLSFIADSKHVFASFSVTRFGDLLDFGQLFKAFGNN